MAAVTKKDAKAFVTEVAETMELSNKGGWRTHAFIGTWLGRPGLTLTIHLQSNAVGRRIIIHKWDDEETCNVRLVKGDGWRDPENFVEFSRVDDVEFTPAQTAFVAATLITDQEEAA